jgi:hypothetical protein
MVGALLVGAVAYADSLPPGGTFVDDDGNVHEGYIEAIAAAGITRGCNPPVDDEYCPARPVTRAEMAAFLVRALGLPAGTPDRFVDDDGSLFEDDIDRIAAAGITLGCDPPTNEQFCPDDPITRGQMAAFLVRAYGYAAAGVGDRFVDDDGSVFEGDIDRLAAAGVTLGCDPPVNDRFCPNDPVRRDEMASLLGRAEGLTPIVPPPRPVPTLEEVTSGLTRPLFATAPAGDNRLFVVEQGGRIRIVAGGTVQATDFLDLSALVFHPEYATNGRFYVSYTNTAGDSRVAEYRVSADPDVADPATARAIIGVDQPATNHNGGMITFDAAGNLLFGLGDGGGSGDPNDRAQDPTDLHGSILRIGVDGDDFPSDPARNYTIPAGNPFAGTSAGADEVWAYGLRNPWRFSLDAETDQLYIGDVGQARWEEVDVAPAAAGGLDYGWNTLEGTHCYEPSTGCSSAGTVLPVLEYGHGDGCSITGGYVSRDDALPDLAGHYFYADYCTGVLHSFAYVDGTVTDQHRWDEFGAVGHVTSFGVDGQDRLLVLVNEGRVLRLTAG